MGRLAPATFMEGGRRVTRPGRIEASGSRGTFDHLLRFFPPLLLPVTFGPGEYCGLTLPGHDRPLTRYFAASAGGRLGPILSEPTFTFPDSNPRNPTPHEGRPQIRNAISEDMEKRVKDEERRAKRDKEDREEQGRLRRADVERALGEFLGYEMYPNRQVGFAGIYLADFWRFKIYVGEYVFRLTRINGCPKKVVPETKKGNYTVEVNTHFLLKYKPDHAPWHPIGRLAEIVDLQREGSLKTN